MKAVSCPRCRAGIPIDDINVKEAVAVCRACGTATRLPDLAINPKLAAVDPANIPDGCWLSGDGVETVLTASCRSLWRFWGSFIPTLIWNFVVAAFVGQLAASVMCRVRGSVPAWFPNGWQKPANPIPLGLAIVAGLFLLPFIAGGLIFASNTVLAVCGRVEVRLRGSQGTVFLGAGPLGWTRRFDAGAVRSIDVGLKAWTRNKHPLPSILMRADRKLGFGTRLPENRKLWLAAVLRKILVLD